MPKFFGFVVSPTQVDYMKKELHSFLCFHNKTKNYKIIGESSKTLRLGSSFTVVLTEYAAADTWKVLVCTNH